jgi:multidrug efflux pump subunit AcrB
MTVRVERNPDGDAIRIQAAVSRAASAMQAELPPGVTLDLVRTRADQISDRLALVIDNGIAGLVLVVALLFLFLNARIALWVAAGIPIAMMAALAVMYLGGLTLNMISLFALIIVIGVVVDDAIVVAEHADWRLRNLGEDPVTAAENGALRMAAPVVASTLTMVIAFFGLVVIGGRFGDLIADIPFTVIAVLLASLVECFLILPHHLSHALRGPADVRWYDLPSHHVNRGMVWFQNRLLKPAMRIMLRLRYPVLAGAILLLAFCASQFRHAAGGRPRRHHGHDARVAARDRRAVHAACRRTRHRSRDLCAGRSRRRGGLWPVGRRHHRRRPSGRHQHRACRPRRAALLQLPVHRVA